MGTAKMRHAITDGFRGSIESMQTSCGLGAHEVVHMMLVTQYLDVLKDFANSGESVLSSIAAATCLSVMHQRWSITI